MRERVRAWNKIRQGFQCRNQAFSVAKVRVSLYHIQLNLFVFSLFGFDNNGWLILLLKAFVDQRVALAFTRTFSAVRV